MTAFFADFGENYRGKVVNDMSIKGFALTLGLGMVGGAVAAAVLPKQPPVKKAISKAADTLENAVETAKTAMCG